VQCETISLELAGVADGLETLAPAAEQHVQRCLRCQAELAQYRKLLRALVSLRDQQIIPDDYLLGEILEALRPPAPVHRLHRRHRRVAYLGGIAAATAAGAAGAIVIATRLVHQREQLAG